MEKAIGELEGVASVQITYADELARISLDAGAHVSDADIIGAVEAAGFRAPRRKEGP